MQDPAQGSTQRSEPSSAPLVVESGIVQQANKLRQTSEVKIMSIQPSAEFRDQLSPLMGGEINCEGPTVDQDAAFDTGVVEQGCEFAVTNGINRPGRWVAKDVIKG